MAAKCLKVVLAIFTCVFVITGAVILGVGLNLLIKEGPFATLLPSFPFLNAANLFIITGAIVLLVSFVGFYGACRENQICLLAFAVLLFVIFVLEVVAGVLGFVYRGQVETYVTNDLTTLGLEKYNMAGESGLTSAWDRMQTHLMCCGVNNSSDWGRYSNEFFPGETPDSCCFAYFDGCGRVAIEEKYHIGCKESLILELSGNVDTICVIGVAVALFQILGICLACTLYSSSRNEKGQYV